MSAFSPSAGRHDRVGRFGIDDDAGQATVELIAILPALMLTGLLLFQLAAVGYTATLADGAAESGAIAMFNGRPATAAVRGALPGWARDRVTVRRRGNAVEVVMRPPSPLSALGERLRISARAAVPSRSPG